MKSVSDCVVDVLTEFMFLLRLCNVLHEFVNIQYENISCLYDIKRIYVQILNLRKKYLMKLAEMQRIYST